MKTPFFLLGGAALLLASCADVRVADTQTAAVVVDRPKEIYIKPFSIAGAQYTGENSGGHGERPIRESLAPATFANDLKQEMEKLAPSRVLASDEFAEKGWLMEGSIDRVDAGSGAERFFSPPLWPGAGKSHVRIHVRVLDLDHHAVAYDEKSDKTLTRHGHTIYEFDVAGGSHASGRYGTVAAPGAGIAEPFDFRNAAERIRLALETDAFRYGERVSPTMR